MKRSTAYFSFIVCALTLLSLTSCNESPNSVNGSSDNISQTAGGASSIPVCPVMDENLSPQVGVNYNGQFDMIRFEDLERTGTRWVRGFVDFFQFYPDADQLHSDERIAKYLELNDLGYKTILNIKWNFRNKNLPQPDSPEMEDYKEYLNKLLTKVWQKTDIIVAGNEPFIETEPAERDERLVEFYKEVAHEINEFKKKRGIGPGQGKGVKTLPLYIGAFNNLYLSGWRTDAVDDLFSFAESESWIAGIDLHIHHGGFLQLSRAIDFAVDKIRPDQKFLITEYSLMKHFRRKTEETIPENFAADYNWDPSTQNYEYIDYTLKNQVPREEWVDFLSSSYWFENRKRYLRNSYQLFKKYDRFYIATYAMRQSFPFNRDFTGNTAPWVLNGLFANRSVEPDPETGQNQFNYGWIEDFKRIQNGFFD